MKYKELKTKHTTLTAIPTLKVGDLFKVDGRSIRCIIYGASGHKTPTTLLQEVNLWFEHLDGYDKISGLEYLIFKVIQVNKKTVRVLIYSDHDVLMEKQRTTWHSMNILKNNPEVYKIDIPILGTKPCKEFSLTLMEDELSHIVNTMLYAKIVRGVKKEEKVIHDSIITKIQEVIKHKV